MLDADVIIIEEEKKKKKRSMAMISWSDLHPDILAQIFKRLYVVDYIRCLSVCAWWRSIPEKTMNFCKPNKHHQTPPWLLVSTPDKPESRCFFYGLSCFHTKTAKYIMNLPQIEGRHCIGSSQGFLITTVVDGSAKLCVLNPLTRACFPLPPTATHPDVLLYDGLRRNAPPRLIIPDDYTRVSLSYHKAIISPSLDIIAVVTKGTVTTAEEPEVARSFCNLAFARAGDVSWTALMSPFMWRYAETGYIPYAISDFIFHKGRLYVLHFNGYLVIFNLENPAAPPVVSSTRPGPTGEGIYLTETPDGEDLLLLWRCSVIEENITKIVAMVVLKLDKNTLEWNLVRSIGDVALFCGLRYLSSLSTQRLPCLKSDCVYFTVDVPFDNVNHMGVYDLKNGSIHPLCPGDDLKPLHLPLPIWFTPTL